MKFLVDAQLPPGLCIWLEARSHEAMYVSRVGMGSASDMEIADFAVAHAAILISKDEDFLHLRMPDRFKLIWMRCGNTTNRALATWLDQRWDQVERLLADGEPLIELK